MANITKTANQSLLAWQDVASAAVAVGSAVDVSTCLGGMVLFWMGRRTGSAFTAGWPNLRLEASARTSGNDTWVPITFFQPAVGSSIANTTLNGAVLAAATTITVASGSNIAAGDLLFLGDSSAANYEIVRVKGISGTTVTPEEAVTYAHANAALVTDQAEMYAAFVDLTGVVRVRAVADNAGSGQAISVQALLVTGDSIG